MWTQAHLRGDAPVWDGPALGMLVDEVTGTVREHISLEREVTNYWLAKYFEQASARDPARTWTALLLHWVRQVRPCSQHCTLHADVLSRDMCSSLHRSQLLGAASSGNSGVRPQERTCCQLQASRRAQSLRGTRVALLGSLRATKWGVSCA